MRWMGQVAHTGNSRGDSGFWWGDLIKRNHLEYRGLDGSMIWKWMFKKWDGGMDWIDLAQNRDR
jgi:hypothetical protein